MSSCLSGGGRAYSMSLDLIKPPTSFSTSNSSSPSSTLSESNNSPLSIFTRKARTPRKRPNQTYNEAVALLSKARPKIFPLTKPFKFRKPPGPFPPEPADLLHYPIERPSFGFQRKGLGLGPLEKSCQSPEEVNSSGICDEFQENLGAESMLDEEMEQGIDGIMGNPTVEIESINYSDSTQVNTCCYGYPVGLGLRLGFDNGYGMRRALRAMRNVDEDWWRFPTVDVADITQKIAEIPVEKKKKKKKNYSESGKKLGNTASGEEAIKRSSGGLLLKLNYDDVLKEWSDKGFPFTGEAPGGESAGDNVQVRLAQIDLFPEKGEERGAIVLRYKEKRCTRLISKKIRYQVRKVNTDQRPRMKGRFVRTGKSGDDD